MHETSSLSCFQILELKHLMEVAPTEVMVIDVRNPEEFEQQHIPGAVNIPLSDLPARLSSLPKHHYLVTACGKGGGRSTEAAGILQSAGFGKADWLCGGTQGWFSAG